MAIRNETIITKTIIPSTLKELKLTIGEIYWSILPALAVSNKNKIINTRAVQKTVNFVSARAILS
jgi:hypothetical protein